jgi:hypothetical protein
MRDVNAAVFPFFKVLILLEMMNQFPYSFIYMFLFACTPISNTQWKHSCLTLIFYILIHFSRNLTDNAQDSWTRTVTRSAGISSM